MLNPSPAVILNEVKDLAFWAQDKLREASRLSESDSRPDFTPPRYIFFLNSEMGIVFTFRNIFGRVVKK